MLTPEVKRDRLAAARRRGKISGRLHRPERPMLPGLELKTVPGTSSAPQSSKSPVEEAKPPFWWAN